MQGIVLDKQVEYVGASFRYFNKKEYHVTRICQEDVLLLVFDGVLRFEEDGAAYEVREGQYHIQKRGLFQQGTTASDSPKYLFVHFRAEWESIFDKEGRRRHNVLPFRGTFSCLKLDTAMKKMDQAAHGNYTQIEKLAAFYGILSLIFRESEKETLAGRIAEYVEKNCREPLSLKLLCEEFHFSKNHMMNVFKKEYGITIFVYLRNVRLKKAEWLLEVTSETAECIAIECGFRDYSCFYKVFHDKHRLSPHIWRQRKRINPASSQGKSFGI